MKESLKPFIKMWDSLSPKDQEELFSELFKRRFEKAIEKVLQEIAEKYGYKIIEK